MRLRVNATCWNTVAVLVFALPGNLHGEGIPKPSNRELGHVYWLGDLPLLDISPDHVPFRIQGGNDRTVNKIRPKSSWS